MLLCHDYENVSIHILPEELVSFSLTFYVQILADVHVCIYVVFLYVFIVFIELLLCFMILCQKWRNKTVQSILLLLLLSLLLSLLSLSLLLLLLLLLFHHYQ